MLKHANLTDQPWLEGLSEEQIDTLAELPKEERLRHYAEMHDKEPDEALTKLGDASGIQVLEDFEMVEEPTGRIPLRLINEFQCLPITNGQREGEDLEDPLYLDLVTVWPPEPMMDKWVFAQCGKTPRWRLGPPELIASTITQKFGVGADSLEDSHLDEFGFEEEEVDEEDENAAIIRFVNEVIHRAIAERATDIHFEPLRDDIQIRYRIDGELVPVRLPDNLVRVQDAIISRLKIMAKLNISEKRRPQDGRITFADGKTEMDIRVSTFPTMYAESVSLRLLNEKSQPLSVRELGLLEDDEDKVNQALARPHGIILVTGPTGAGKSTSLTAFLRKINHPERRIITVEDPVEYEVPGVNQTQIHHDIGLDFSAALRHILRQDPDVIMVGEIRDRETADIGIRASLTGHLVLSTLHTNDAPGALTRLIDMDIEPFLIASSVEMIIAQRLVRRLCQHCAKPTEQSESMLRSQLITLGIDPSEMKNAHLIREPNGCDRCGGRGYRGRVGIFEVLVVTEEIHSLIVKKASARIIREEALAQGMRSLQECGWEQVKRGLTCLPDIMRYAEIGKEDAEEA
ncbi:MAG: GspE/PulE family protein [Opitutae bacterium]